MRYDYPEELLHYLWKHKLLQPITHTHSGSSLSIIHEGIHNPNSGPDFLEACIELDNKRWYGSIEIHKKSSDWYLHQHQHDAAYDNVILHVVAEHTGEIHRKNGEIIPSLEIGDKLEPGFIHRYTDLIQNSPFIPCESLLNNIAQKYKDTACHQALLERLESKSASMSRYLEGTQYDWEQALFYFLCKNFGFKVNSEPMERLAERVSLKLLAKHKDDLEALESILFGASGLLQISRSKEEYVTRLKSNYQFFAKKYKIMAMEPVNWRFSRMRPSNFPSIRIAQLAALIHSKGNLFSKILDSSSFEEVQEFFFIEASEFWKHHFHFEERVEGNVKKLGKTSIENLLINTVSPLLFAYGKLRNDKAQVQKAIEFLSNLPSEDNKIIRNFVKCGWKVDSAAQSQALLQLKKFHCDEKKCLNCAVGIQIMNNS